MTPDVMRFVRQEIARQLNVILSGVCESTRDVETESIGQLYPGMPTIENRPVMHPYGFASRAPAGTIEVVAKQGADPSNRIVIGHRDAKRPKDIDEGESAIYSKGGWAVTVKNDSVKIASKDGKTAIDAKTDAIEIKVGDAKIKADASGVVEFTLGPSGTLKFANGQGDLIDALLQIFNGSTAGGFNFIPNPAGLAIVQSMKG